MRKNHSFVLLVISIFVILILSISINKSRIIDNPIDNKVRPDNIELVSEVEGYINNAKYHPKCLNELLNIAKRTKYNKEVIKNAAYFISQAGFNTLTVMEIARIAGNVNHEVKYLNDLLEVSITYNAESFDIIRLAQQAANNLISKADLEEKITYYRNNSKWKTIDETIENAE